jgi:hypothetical protein
MTDIEPYDLALLAAQLMSRQNSPRSAVETALSLLDQAELQLERVRLRALAESPEAQAELERREAERKAKLHVPYEKGVKLIARVDRWSGDYGALNWFKKFLRWKATKQEETQDATAARADAWVAKYRGSGFTGTEVERLRDEFDHWRNKGTQGRVKKKRRDGRLHENRQRKAKEKGEAAWKELVGPRQRTKPELEFVAKTEVAESAAVTSGKTPVRSGDTLVRDADAPRT